MKKKVTPKLKMPISRSVTHVESGPIGRTLFSFAIPVIISQLLQEFYSIADCAVIGRFVGGNALAAVGVSGLILSVLVNFFIGFASGISIITAQLFGKYDHSQLKKTISTVIRLVFFVGIGITAIMFLLSKPSLVWIHCPYDVNAEALTYLKICLFGLTAQLIYNVGTAILRSLGDTRTPMLFFLGSVLCNLILDVLFVVVFHFGIAGAAAATLSSQWFLAIAIFIRLCHLDPAYALRTFGAHLSPRAIWHILRNGIPAGMQALFMSISSLLIQVSINNFGPDAMAGMTVYAKIEGFLYFPAFAYGIALTGFVGQNVGAGKPDRVRKATRLSALIMIAAIIPLSLILMAASPKILMLFTSNAGILQNAQEAVFYTFPVYFIYAINQVFLGSVKGMGSTMYPMLCTLLCYSIFRVAWCRILIPIYPSMKIVYLSYDVSFLLMLLLLAPMYIYLLRKISSADS